ncbi:ATP-binding protein [Olsenella sp. HMSC062G07]|uniref:ATP-binding protein n=1 Tax=Olsenella sp. HMSC062G07 TaxID=1739330 RepID=UPI0008A3C55A|nr:ATP-binding protein [Olsenella sp. HMSC062G07]OFK24661.1 ATPase [Olsenella sp. HMSC062G07]
MSASDDLADFISDVGLDRSLRVEENLGEGFVRLRVSEAERRQAKQDVRCVEDAVLELLRNARDAGARHVFLALSREGDTRTLVMLDDGCGIPDDLRERVFDARVTSKLDSFRQDRWGVHGRGMALFSVRENAASACVSATVPGRGTAVKVAFDVTRLPERKDQSSWPAFEVVDDGERRLTRGPHNIIRRCCEFALEEHGSLDVWVGSPSDVAATLRGKTGLVRGPSELLFVDGIDDLGVLERFPAAADATELLDAARSVGLEMGERTAHRVCSGQIKPVRSVYATLTRRLDRRGPVATKPADIYREARRLRIDARDASAFSRLMRKDFSYLADRYYLDLMEDPEVRATGGKVVVTFRVSQDD